MFNIGPWKLLPPRSAVNKPPAEWFDAVTRALTTMVVIQVPAGSAPRFDRPNTNGFAWSLELPPFGDESSGADRTFHCALDGSTVTVSAGTVYVHRYATADVAEGSVELSGSAYEVISVRFNWGAQTAEIVSTQDAEPTDTDEALHVILRRYDYTDGAWVAQAVKHDGDVHVWTAVA